MKHSLRHGGGYLEIDHRDSPGLTPSDVAHVPGAIPVAAGQRFETDVYQCSHCQRQVVLHAPADRMQFRGYCQKCDHYICNNCEALRVKTGACVPFVQVLDRAADIVEQFVGQPDHPDAVIDPVSLSQPGPPKIVVP